MGTLPPARRGLPRIPEAERQYGGHTYAYKGFTQKQAEARADRHVANIEKLDQELKEQRAQ